MKNNRMILGVIGFMLAVVGCAVPAHASAIASGSVQVEGVTAYPLPEVAEFMAQGCKTFQSSGTQVAIINVSKHLGQRILIQVAGADVQNETQDISIGALVDCSPADVYGSGANSPTLGGATPGKPFAWTVTRPILIIVDTAGSNVGQRYQVLLSV